MRDMVKAFKALADDTKIRIINLLLERECCVCEVMQVLDISQSKASRHLSSLYDAGFLRLRKDGLWSLYSLDKEGMRDYMSLLVEAVTGGLRGNKVAEQDRERLRNAERLGPSYVERMRTENKGR
ncbi:MAG: winged helix-turn-helix transcriptional regulator [Chloroflexi bacterium]|nr:winged helix-turn-helix transcriptional regulator [Chloroflexota bacterium]